MNVLFSTEVGAYLQNKCKDNPESVVFVIRQLEKLKNDVEEILAKIPHTTLDGDIHLLSMGDFIITVMKRPNGDLYVTDITKGVLPSPANRKAG